MRVIMSVHVLDGAGRPSAPKPERYDLLWRRQAAADDFIPWPVRVYLRLWLAAVISCNKMSVTWRNTIAAHRPM